MGTYEIVAVLRADLDEEALSAAFDAINKRITDNGGTVTGVDRWGKRKLAYPIKKHRDGFYALVVFGLDATRIPALRQTLGLQEDVLRLTVSKHYPKPEPAAAAHASAGAATAPGATATTHGAGATTPGAPATTPGAAATTQGAGATTQGARATTLATAAPTSSTEGTPEGTSAPAADPSNV